MCEAMENSENSQDSVGGDEFKESVEDATKRELCAFKTEAKRWSQTDNRLLVPLQTAQHVRARRILSEIYICICTFTCCFLYVIGLKSFSLCVNTGSTPNAPSSSGLSAGVSSSGQPSAAMPGLTSPSAGQSFCFCVCPFLFCF